MYSYQLNVGLTWIIEWYPYLDDPNRICPTIGGESGLVSLEISSLEKMSTNLPWYDDDILWVVGANSCWKWKGKLM